jgi:hypothetical protein
MKNIGNRWRLIPDLIEESGTEGKKEKAIGIIHTRKDGHCPALGSCSGDADALSHSQAFLAPTPPLP